MENNQSALARFLKVARETWTTFTSVVLFLIAVGVSGGIIGAIVANIFYIAVGFGSAVILGIGLILLITQFNLRRKHDVKVKAKYVTYRYYPDGSTMEHTKLYKIISLKDGLKEFRDRYKWACSKQQRCKVHLVVAQHQKLYEEVEMEWRVNRIEFDPPLHRAEEAEIALKWDLYCEEGAVHFLSQPVEHETDYLELSVFSPFKPVEIKLVHFNQTGGVETDPATVVERVNGEFNATTGEIRYSIHKPKLRHKYMIRWTPSNELLFPDGVPSPIQAKIETRA